MGRLRTLKEGIGHPLSTEMEKMKSLPGNKLVEVVILKHVSTLELPGTFKNLVPVSRV